jgi:hypothetical protein
VRGYSAELQTLKGLPIVTAGTVYIDPKTGERFLLVIHECIFFRDRLRNSLLCPNQMRAHGVIVNDVPTQFDATSTHSIITTDLTIPLDMLGVVSFFDTSLPQPGALDTLPWVTLTAPANWVDHASTLPTNERRVPDRISLLSSQVTYQPTQLEPLHIDRSISHLMEDDTYYNATIASVNIESTYTLPDALPTINESDDFISADPNY